MHKIFVPEHIVWECGKRWHQLPLLKDDSNVLCKKQNRGSFRGMEGGVEFVFDDKT